MKFHVSFILLCLLASEMAHAGSCSDQQREKLQSKVVDACKTTSMRCLGTDNKATLNSVSFQLVLMLERRLMILALMAEILVINKQLLRSQMEEVTVRHYYLR